MRIILRANFCFSVNAIFTGSTDIIGGISGPGSNVYVCGVPGWVQTA